MADDNTPQAPPAANDEGILHSLATSFGLDPEVIKSTAKAILAHPGQVAQEVGSQAASEISAAAKAPTETALKAVGDTATSLTQNPEAQATAKSRFNQPGIGNKLAGAAEYLTSGVPVVGGNLTKSEEQAAQGNIGGSLGTLAGTIAPLFVGDAEELPENIHRAGAEARANIDARSAARLDEARTGKVLTVEPEKPSAQLKEVPKQLEGLRVQLHPREIAENQGLVYKGELFPDSGVHQFEHPNHPGQTAALKEPITPEALKAKMAAKVQEFQEPHITFNEIGGKEVQAPPTKTAAPVDMSPAYGDTGRSVLAASKPAPPAEVPAAPAYHPDLQSLADTYGVSSDASRVKNGGSFITPDGKFIHLPGGATHDSAIADTSEDRPQGIQGGTSDNRPGFLKDTGAIRTRFTKGRAGNELAISVPAAGVTPEQVSAIRQAVGQGLGRNGNLAIEVGEKNGEFTRKEFARPSDVEPMLQKIGVHPDQHEDSLVAGEMQSPLKGDYSVRVAHGDGTETVEKVPAFSGQDALKQIQKKFPEASAWGIEKNSEGYYRPEPKAPSTEYTVPNKKLASIPSRGKEPVAVIRHELGHGLIGYQHGLETDGVLRHTHPDVKGNAVAAVKWHTGGITDRAGKVKPEALPTIVHSLMGGIAADEVFNNTPRGTNHNFDPTVVGSDARTSVNILKELGYSHDEAMDFLHKAIDANKEYLSKPEVASVVKENENVREPDLSNQYHYSPERLQNMHREIQRRIGNAKNTEQPNNGAVSAENAGEREANVSSGKGGGAEEPGQSLQAHEIAEPSPEEKSAQDDYEKEKQFAGAVLEGKKKLEDFPYYSGYQQTIDAESQLMPKGKTLFVGGGPVPASSILLHRAGFPVDTLELDPETTKLGEQVARKSGMTGGKFITGDARAFKNFGDYDNIVVALEAGPTGATKNSVLRNITAQAKPGTKILARGTADAPGGGAFVDVNKSLPQGFAVSHSVPTFEGYGQTHVLHSNDWHETAGKAAATAEAGGIDPHTGKSDTTGIGVEVLPELRQPLDHAPTANDFKKFHQQHQDIFNKNPELRVGWDNNSKVPGGHEVNVGAVGPNAAKVAKKLDQVAAFDIDKNQPIFTKGSGLRTEFPNYSLEDRLKDLRGENQSNTPGFEHLSKDVYDHLEPDERDYLKGDKTIQQNVMSQYHKLQPSVNETSNAMQAGAALGGWWKRYIDIFHNLTSSETEAAASAMGPSHAEILKQWHAALSANKNVEDANNLAWHTYADWLDAGKPTDRTSIDAIVRKNGAQPAGAEKRGNAAMSDTRGPRGRLITEGTDTSKLFNLVNSPEMKGERPFHNDVFSEGRRNPLMGKGEGYRKVPSMGATVAGKGNLNRIVLDSHMRDFYGQPSQGPAAQYIADSVHLRQAAKALGLKGGEGQEQLWGTVLGLKTLLKQGLTPEEAGGTLSADTIRQIGKDYAEVIANDPEITKAGGVLDRLKEKYNIGGGSAGVGEAYRKTLGTGTGSSQQTGSQAPVDPSLVGKTAGRIRGQIADVKIKKPAASKSGAISAIDLINMLSGLKKPAK